jgi:zinc transporter ZupT
LSATVTVLLYSTIAAAAAGLGALPLAARDRPPRAALGWANALAAGLMLGSAYVLTAYGESRSPLAGALGAVAGIALTWWAHVALGAEDLDLNRLAGTDAAYGRKVVLLHSFHSAFEGIAIGVAMVQDRSLGIFMALAIAVHNVPEGAVLAAVLRGRGVSLGAAAGLAVATNASQVLLSVAAVTLVKAIPATLPWVVGLAAGSLVLLLIAEPLPEAYHQAGAMSIALVASLALSLVVLLRGVFVNLRP